MHVENEILNFEFNIHCSFVQMAKGVAEIV